MDLGKVPNDYRRGKAELLASDYPAMAMDYR
jgi:hypothetical protein